MQSLATASSSMIAASASRAGGVITRRSPSTVQPRKQNLVRVPCSSKQRQRAASVVTRASGDDDDNEGVPQRPKTSRRDIINGVFFAISVPLWIDIAHDLGYVHGTEEGRCIHPTTHTHITHPNRCTPSKCTLCLYTTPVPSLYIPTVTPRLRDSPPATLSCVCMRCFERSSQRT
jgi:hypothetical protein